MIYYNLIIVIYFNWRKKIKIKRQTNTKQQLLKSSTNYLSFHLWNIYGDVAL